MAELVILHSFAGDDTYGIRWVSINFCNFPKCCCIAKGSNMLACIHPRADTDVGLISHLLFAYKADRNTSPVGHDWRPIDDLSGVGRWSSTR